MNNEQNSEKKQGPASGGGSPLDRYTVQPQSDPKNDSPFYKSAAPVISLPKGGGALKGIDEKFSVNAVNGTAGLEIALPLTPGRGGFTPSLSLSYNSGSGNSEYGLGWGLGLPAIQRKTDKKLPLYNDTQESDVFLLAGAEDLIPVLDDKPNPFTDGIYHIKRYRPRIEGLFARIEYIKRNDAAAGWWRVTTKDNITTYYGLTAGGRIADPQNDYRVFKWLPQLSIDHKGNVLQYMYVAEDTRNVSHQVNERNRLNGTAPITNLYLKRVQYCNTVPYFVNNHLSDSEDNSFLLETNIYQPNIDLSDDTESVLKNVNFLMEAVWDYGDHSSPEKPNPDVIWPGRSDAFSDFHAGFEIRTYRRCMRVLMFHYFTELGTNNLVRALELQYKNGAYNVTDHFTEADLLVSATQRGYLFKGAGYRSKALPAMQFHYQPLHWDTKIHKVDKADFKHAPQGLTGPYQWMDFDGEGISGILTEQGAGWFYKNNLGDGHFDTAKSIAPKPNFTGLGSSALQWQDLDADGRRQVVSEAPVKGYWELDDDQKWQPFQTFAKSLNIDWNSPFTKMLDLNGDGKPDVIITEDRAWTWYENKGKKGFETGGSAAVYTDEEKGPMLLLRDAVQSIFLADMNGDGMTDLVRIKNGEICYWPNRGYGKFGSKVAMVNAPVFESPEGYNPLYLSLADISGTGAADLIYIGKNKCTTWLNLAGNGWGAAVDINPLPGTNAMSKISVLDFLGNGTGCIVWSSPLPHHATAPLQYIDLMGGNKPFLMRSYDSGMGKTVSVQYKSSTQFYLADKLAGKPWITKLPFPVHCIESVTTEDKVSQTKYTQTYKYRHGYYDHEEREFRGFGYVETQDIDSALVSDHEALDQKPVLTKTWNHTGAWIREQTLLDQYRKEYFQFEDWDHITQIATLPDAHLLNAQEWREAHRALKGSPLRQEVYAVDGSDKAAIPYSITATAYQVKMIQAKGDNRYASFLNYQQQSISITCERDFEDPRIAQQFTLEVDEYGNVLKTASVAYPRKHTAASLPARVAKEQGKMHISYAENRFTNDVIGDANVYRLRLGCEAKSYEVLGLKPPANHALWQAEVLREQIGLANAIDFTAQYGSGIRKRLLSHSRSYFKNDAAEDVMLPLAELQSLAIPYQQYHLAYTSNDFEKCFDARLDISVLEEGRYIHLEDPEKYWLPSGTAQYQYPLTNFYTPQRFFDPWGTETRVVFWGDYWLLPQGTIDALGNSSNVISYDWRILQPTEMQDINLNVSEIIYDALGLPVGMALKGKGDYTEGDTFSDWGDYDTGTDLENQALFFSDAPEQYAGLLLNGATWRCIYDLEKSPVAVAMIATQHHYYSAGYDQNEDCVIRISYSDGFGRVIMHKAPARPDALTPDKKRWIASGRTIYNNKGNAVMQFEPYFSDTHRCDKAEAAMSVGVSPKLYYDALDRNYRTELPDETFTQTEWTAWEQIVYDNNDTVKDSNWYSRRINGNLSHIDEEKDAAIKAAAHYDTPAIMHTDTLARPFYTIQTDNINGAIESYVNLDAVGNHLSVVDGLKRMALQYQYNMLKQVCRQSSIDSGTGYALTDIAGQPLYALDAMRDVFKMEYDALRRVTQKWCNGKLLEKMVYGEFQNSAEDRNLRGQLYEHYDGSGKQSIPNGYDFKGNPVITSQTLLLDKILTDVDWLLNPQLDNEVFSSTIEFDALNRPETITDPGGNITRHAYDKTGALMQVSLNGKSYVNDIHYDARGRRQSIWYANRTKTKYSYDAQTYRLHRLFTVRLDDNEPLQDLNYYYDPVGNITTIKDDAQQTLYFNNTVVTPTQTYTYDALYRLLQAKGRELKGTAGFGTEDSWDDTARQTTQKSDGSAVQNYTQNYTYDAVGNILQLQHVADVGAYTRNYEYGSTGNKLLHTTIGAQTYDYDAYDARGNMLLMPHIDVMAWNKSNELCRIQRGKTLSGYQYSGGQRIRKFVNKGHVKEERIYLGNFEIYRKFDAVSSLIVERQTVHVNDDTGRIAMLEKRTHGSQAEDNDTSALLTRHVYSNHLQSATLECDESGEIISYEEYHPYGTTAYQGMNADIKACAKRYRYTGKERDEESGLYYHGARYYVPWLGRWCAVDPLESKYAGLSPYNYSFNNPIVWNDLNGADPEDGEPKSDSITLNPSNGTPPNYTYTYNVYDYKGNPVSSITTTFSNEFKGFPHGQYTTDEYLPNPNKPAVRNGDPEAKGIASFEAESIIANSYKPFEVVPLPAEMNSSELLNYGGEGAAAFILSPIRGLGNMVRKGLAMANGDSTYNRMYWTETEMGATLVGVNVPTSGASLTQIANDLDALGLSGGGPAGSMIAKASAVKPSTVVKVTEEIVDVVKEEKTLIATTEEVTEHLVKLTKNGTKTLGNLTEMKDMPMAAGIIKRGGNGSNVNKIATWLQQMKIGDVANLAAKGDKEAEEAIKILKQAKAKGQNY